MSKQAKIFQDLLRLPEKQFMEIVWEYKNIPFSFTKDEREVIDAMLALADD